MVISRQCITRSRQRVRIKFYFFLLVSSRTSYRISHVCMYVVNRFPLFEEKMYQENFKSEIDTPSLPINSHPRKLIFMWKVDVNIHTQLIIDSTITDKKSPSRANPECGKSVIILIKSRIHFVRHIWSSGLLILLHRSIVMIMTNIL